MEAGEETFDDAFGQQLEPREAGGLVGIQEIEPST